MTCPTAHEEQQEEGSVHSNKLDVDGDASLGPVSTSFHRAFKDPSAQMMLETACGLHSAILVVSLVSRLERIASLRPPHSHPILAKAHMTLDTPWHVR